MPGRPLTDQEINAMPISAAEKWRLKASQGPSMMAQIGNPEAIVMGAKLATKTSRDPADYSGAKLGAGEKRDTGGGFWVLGADGTHHQFASPDAFAKAHTANPAQFNNPANKPSGGELGVGINAGEWATAETGGRGTLGGAAKEDAKPAAGEQAFQAWYAKIAKKNDLDTNPDAPEHKYDYRSAWRAGVEPGKDGHWDSRFKRPDHPNRYVDGVDTMTGAPMPPKPKPTPAAPPSAVVTSAPAGPVTYTPPKATKFADGAATFDANYNPVTSKMQQMGVAAPTPIAPGDRAVSPGYAPSDPSAIEALRKQYSGASSPYTPGFAGQVYDTAGEFAGATKESFSDAIAQLQAMYGGGK